MPVAVRITPHKMSREDYERIMKLLSESGAGLTEGRLFHAGYGDDDVGMFDIWDSRESFEPYRARLMALLEGAGIDGGVVEIDPLHRRIG